MTDIISSHYKIINLIYCNHKLSGNTSLWVTTSYFAKQIQKNFIKVIIIQTVAGCNLSPVSPVICFLFWEQCFFLFLLQTNFSLVNFFDCTIKAGCRSDANSSFWCILRTINLKIRLWNHHLIQVKLTRARKAI